MEYGEDESDFNSESVRSDEPKKRRKYNTKNK